MTRRHRNLRVAGVAAMIAAGMYLLPPTRARMQAVPTLAESLGLKVPRPLAADVSSKDTSIGGVDGRIYSAGAGDPAILLVPGATPAGVEDARVVQVATALARNGRQVFLPRLALYSERLVEADLEALVQATRGLATSTGQQVNLVGFSYGGSLALVAAADPRIREDLHRLAVFGAYFDLIGVIQAITGGASVVGDATIEWQGHPLARDVLYARAMDLAPPHARDELVDAIGGKNHPAALDPESRAVYELLVNRDPCETYPLAQQLSPQARTFLARFSPSTVATDIEVPVLAMHSTDDPLVPYGELARLAAGMPGARTITVDLFSHVDFKASEPNDWVRAAPDLWALWRFTAWLLEP
ncbi:MAG: alpha/beta fold hydrolase [Actinomycetota bacterium]